MGLPWREASDDLASGWRRMTSPCQKNNYKRKVHAYRFLENSLDGTLLLAPKREHIKFTILFWKSTQSTCLENAAKFQKDSQTLDSDSYGQCKGSHGKRNPREIGCFRISTHGAAIIWLGDCIIRLFHFGWLKIQLERREYNWEDELYELVDEIVTDLSIKMIETVFVDWMNQLECLIDGHGDYVS
jgi:hypothetical protein